MSDEPLHQLRTLSTPAVSDALDRLGIAGQCFGIMPLDPDFRLAGRAFTLRYGPVGQDPGTVGDYIDDLGPGDVVVLDNQGRLDATVWGDILTESAHRRGLAGTVIDGICRDRDRTRTLNYPIYSRGHWMRTGKDRVRVEQTGAAVSIGGVRVQPGDLLLGDGDGLVVLPAERAPQIVTVAAEIETVEEAIRVAVRDGLSLREARREHGYHTLQRRTGD